MHHNITSLGLGLLLWTLTSDGDTLGQNLKLESPANLSTPTGDVRQASANGQPIDAANSGTAEPTAEQAKEGPEKLSLQSPRALMHTFVLAMETKDYRTAVMALDFSQIDPAPDTFQQIHYAQMLKMCMDRIALVDLSLFSDNAEGPVESFPPGKTDAMLMLGRGPDGQWRFTAQTVASIPAMSDILRDRPPIGEAEPSATTVPSGSDTTEETQQEAEQQPGEHQEKPEFASPEVPDQFSSARRTMRTFFDAMQAKDYPSVVATLDFSKIEKTDPDLGSYAKLEYARRLKEVIERMANVNYAEINDDPNGPSFRFPVDAVNQPIVISRGESGAWRFSAETVDRIDSLHEVYRGRKVLFITGAQRPWYMREFVLGNEVWRILVLFAAIFLSILAGQGIRYFAQRRAEVLKKRDRVLSSLAYETVAKTARGVTLMIGLALGINALVLDFGVERFTETVIHVVLTLVVGYISFRLVDVVVGFLRELAKKSGSTLNDMLAPVVSTALRITIILLVILEIATAVSDQPPSALIAGLGAGGLAIGLAAQDTIKNFFGSVMIFADRPFELGDRIVVDGHDGPVESVGFRSTRIRTLDGHLVTVPNGEMSNRTVHNIGKRPFIRRVMNLRVAYDLPTEKVQRALEILRDLLDRH